MIKLPGVCTKSIEMAILKGEKFATLIDHFQFRDSIFFFRYQVLTVQVKGDGVCHPDTQFYS